MRALFALFTLLLVLPASLPAFAQTGGKNGADALPDLRIARGSSIAEAWLITPTKRYPHFVQGSQYEASGVRVRMADGQVLTLMLDDSHVFEDRQPRLADLNGDGTDEIVLILTSLTKGASLAVYGVENDKIVRIAKTDFIGRPFRWLNPAGIADFDGDGHLDIALVAMPHLIKRLEFWTLAGRSLRLIASGTSYSNHRNGSVHTGMSVVADVNKDGLADLILPSGDRRSLKAVTLKGGTIRTLGTVALSGLADGAFAIKQTPAGIAVRVGLSGGGSDRVLFTPDK